MTFLNFPRDRHGCIAIVPFFSYIIKKSQMEQMYCRLMDYDTLCRGYLTEKEMENFVFELIPELPKLSTLQEEFYPFYVFTAVRKFFFFIDPKRTGRLHLSDLHKSPIFTEFHTMRSELPMEASEAARNWFSMQSALNIYGMYLELDKDQNGMLSKNELSGYGSGMLTDVFIGRVFEEYQTFPDTERGEREIDYKSFLDFVLAMQNRSTQQALRYFWKILDIRHQGYIDGFEINYFFGAVVRLLKDKGLDAVSVDDVRDEIFDMVCPLNRERITFADLAGCKQGGTVVGMIIDAAAFYKYDHRESLLQKNVNEDDSDFDEEDEEDSYLPSALGAANSRLAADLHLQR